MEQPAQELHLSLRDAPRGTERIQTPGQSSAHLATLHGRFPGGVGEFYPSSAVFSSPTGWAGPVDANSLYDRSSQDGLVSKALEIR